MRDRDRLWWIILILGLAFCAASGALPWYFLSMFPLGGPYSTPADDQQTIGMAIFLGMLCLCGGVFCICMAAFQQGHHRKRLAAFRGDLATMPLAIIQPDPAQAPDVATQPLEVMWRMSRGLSLGSVYLLTVSLEILAALLSIVAALLGLIAPMLILPQPVERYLFNQDAPAPMSASEIATRIALTCAVIALAVGGGVYVARVFPTLLGRPFGVRASAEGVDGRTPSGSRVHIAWGEATLFEVSSGSAKVSRAFALYAPGKAITWNEYRTGFGSEYAPAGATESELALRQAALLNLIAARTGLEPRTLVKSLWRDQTGAPTSARRADAFALAILAMVIVGLAVAEWFFPITPYAWANWPSEGALALLTALLFALAIMMARRPQRATAQGGPPPVAAPTLDAPGITYALDWRVPTLRRAGIAGVGLLLAANLIPVAVVTPQALSSGPPGTNPLGQFGSVILAIVLGVLGLTGALITIMAARPMTIHIRANADGLSRARIGGAKLIPWATVREVVWNPHGLDGSPVYAMRTYDALEVITWPTSPRYLVTATPRDGAVPIGPDELAALVTARIGRPARVVT